MKVVIAGGGATGCLAALLLARAGHEVLVLERDRCAPPRKVMGMIATPGEVYTEPEVVARTSEQLRAALMP